MEQVGLGSGIALPELLRLFAFGVVAAQWIARLATVSGSLPTRSLVTSKSWNVGSRWRHESWPFRCDDNR
jgi:hypothetical protein